MLFDSRFADSFCSELTRFEADDGYTEGRGHDNGDDFIPHNIYKFLESIAKHVNSEYRSTSNVTMLVGMFGDKLCVAVAGSRILRLMRMNQRRISSPAISGYL